MQRRAHAQAGPLFGLLGSLVRLLAITLVAVAFSLALLIIAQRALTPFHVVTGESMSPQVKSGDAVVLGQVEPDDIKVGQVIIFRDPEDRERLVIHRVVAVEDTGSTRLFTTKGDNNPVKDTWKVAPGDVVGDVLVNVPGLGSFLRFITRPRGYIGCVAIPAAVALSLAVLLGIGELAGRPRYRGGKDVWPGDADRPRRRF